MIGIARNPALGSQSKMKIFLSYSSQDRPKAEEIAMTLQAQGHDVFFDKEDLSGGEDFHSVIREHVANADLFVFLISPASVRPGAYTLTELRLIREKWASPTKHVLPVMLEPTDLDAIPPYLKAVTILKPEGSVAAEVGALINPSSRSHATILIGGTTVAVAVIAFLFYTHFHQWIFKPGEPSNRPALTLDSINGIFSIDFIVVGKSENAGPQEGWKWIHLDLNAETKKDRDPYIYLTWKPADTSDSNSLITSLSVHKSKDSKTAKEKLRNEGYSLIDKDLNQGAGGDFIYLGYKRGEAGKKPITDLRITYDNDRKPEKDGFNRINVDLNAGAGGKFVYLWYRRN